MAAEATTVCSACWLKGSHTLGTLLHPRSPLSKFVDVGALAFVCVTRHETRILGAPVPMALLYKEAQKGSFLKSSKAFWKDTESREAWWSKTSHMDSPRALDRSGRDKGARTDSHAESAIRFRATQRWSGQKEWANRSWISRRYLTTSDGRETGLLTPRVYLKGQSCTLRGCADRHDGRDCNVGAPRRAQHSARQLARQ